MARALWRSQEAKSVATEELPRPVLDLGCSFGEFASVFFDDPVDAGMDIILIDLVRSKRGQGEKFLARADALRLPFLNESFPSVFSISVLEHIPHVDEAVAEAYGALNRGGVFVFTTPTLRFNEFLFYSRILKRVGLSPISRFYAALLNGALNDVSLLNEEDCFTFWSGSDFELNNTE